MSSSRLVREPTTNQLSGPTITRSMSRKSIATSLDPISSSSSAMIDPFASKLSTKQQLEQQHLAKVLPRLRREAGQLGLGSRKEGKKVGGMSSRSSSRDLNLESAPVPKRRVVSGQTEDRKRLIKPIGSATSSSAGMGVRRGPAIVGSSSRTVSSTLRNEKRVARRSLSPAKLSPAKLSAATLAMQDDESNPFSANFKSNKRIFSDKVEVGKKRGFEESLEGEEDGIVSGRLVLNRVLSPTKGESPAKRIHLSSEDGEPKRKNGGPDKTTSTSSPRRTRTSSDENGKSELHLSNRPQSHQRVPSFDSYPCSNMEIDSETINKSPVRSLSRQNRARGMNTEESDDDCDLLSPKKLNGEEKRFELEGENQLSKIPTGLRSPMQRKRITTGLKKPISITPTTSTGPVSRPPFCLSSMTVPPPREPVAIGSVPVNRVGTSSILPSKYSAIPLASSSSTLSSALAIGALASQSSSSTGGATSQAMKRSGIPRPAANFPPVFNPHRSTGTRSGLPPAPSHYSYDNSFASGSTSLFDIIISEEPNEEALSLADQSSGNVSVAEETSTKLANLQAMLSRLAMPRQSMGSTSTLQQKRSSLPAVDRPPSMLAEMKVSRRQTLTGSFNEEYTLPLSGGDDVEMGPPVSNMVRSVSKMSGRQSLSEPFLVGPVSRESGSGLGLGRPSSVSSAATGSNRDSAPISKTARRTSALLPSSASTATLNALEENEYIQQQGIMDDVQMDLEGGKKKFMKDVIAFVDVRTLEGDDAGMIFIDMLKSMGARVTSRPTANLTHIIYKSGRPGTIARYRAAEGPKPFLVGIGWVVRCAEMEAKVDEKNYLVGDSAPVVSTQHRRRKSVEPRMGFTGTGSINPNLQATIAASIDRARRQSLQFQPKIGSPLAKRVFQWEAEETVEIDETF